MSARTLPYDAWAVAAPGLEPLVERELRALGVADAAAAPGGVAFAADAAGLARANLHLRIASRVVVRLASFRATAFHELERAARKVEWGRMLAPGAQFSLRVTARKSRLYHSDAIAERVAGAIARAVPGTRLTEAAGAQLFVVRFERDRCTVSADTSGELLHRRGYRQAVARAPLRETLAAAMLEVVGHDPAHPLLDPFCGSGTLLIEAAMRARGIAPGLARRFVAESWPESEPSRWALAREEARAAERPRAMAQILGSDRDAGAVEAAMANAARAGVEGDISVAQRALSAIELPSGPGLLITNPPYGVRVGEGDALRDLYARFGQVVRAQGAGWRVAMLAADDGLLRHTELKFRELLRTTNGGIPVRVMLAG